MLTTVVLAVVIVSAFHAPVAAQRADRHFSLDNVSRSSRLYDQLTRVQDNSRQVRTVLMRGPCYHVVCLRFEMMPSRVA